MTITLYKNNSDNIVVDKSLTFLNELDGNFRDDESLINPVILIDKTSLETFYEIQYDNEDVQYDDEDIAVTLDFNINDTNYLYIKEFNRYYFINDINVYNNQLLILSCHVDVLMSYKDIFRNLNALISRNEYDYDEYIEDEKQLFDYKLDMNEYDVTINDELNFNPALNDTSKFNYIINVLTNVGASIKSNVESPNSSLPDVSDQTSGKTLFATPFAMKLTDIDNMILHILDNESDASYIISLICYPFEITDVDNEHYSHVVLGKNIVNTATYYQLNHNTSKYYKVARFYINTYAGFDRGYLEREPYSTYELYLPYYGWVTLKSTDVIDKLIEVYYSFDWVNGTAKINIVNATDNIVIKSVSANIGIKISVNRTNQQQLNDEKTQLAITSAISGVTSIASVFGGIASTNPYLLSSGVTGLASTVANIGTSLSKMHEKAETSNTSGKDGLYGSQKIKLKVTKMIKLTPTDYNKYYGKPLNQTKLLSTLSGYTEIKDIRLDNFNGTNNEKNELISLLTSGIIL